ncbi:MAG: AzlD domain-containing protein [Betaproteobacteria bacterium]|nr:AzlD domain-containing protein [Betaproteobacteria bacterium]
MGASLLALLVMGVSTFLMRAGGYWLMAHVPLTARVHRMLEALPGALVVAVVLPIAGKIGVTAFLAIAAAAVMMVLRHNGFLAVVSGLIVAALARSLGI